MLAAPVEKASFTAESIRAMSPMAQGIAAMLKDAGWIEITDQKPAGGVEP